MKAYNYRRQKHLFDLSQCAQSHGELSRRNLTFSCRTWHTSLDTNFLAFLPLSGDRVEIIKLGPWSIQHAIVTLTFEGLMKPFEEKKGEPTKLPSCNFMSKTIVTLNSIQHKILYLFVFTWLNFSQGKMWVFLRVFVSRSPEISFVSRFFLFFSSQNKCCMREWNKMKSEGGMGSMCVKEGKNSTHEIDSAISESELFLSCNSRNSFSFSPLIP